MAKSKPRFGHGTGKPHPVDIHVGARARMRRTLLGMTQTDLGDALDLTYQQVQKYERGVNRISASRLYDLCRVLDVSIDYFFEDMPTAVAANSSATKGRGNAQKLTGYEPDPMANRETLGLVRAFYKIEDAEIRRQVYEMIKVLGPASV